MISYFLCFLANAQQSMSNNIWGYQGLQTPLENLTRGNYNVADYTNMRKEFGARITALENTGGFQPTNIAITGFMDLVPGTAGNGDLTVAGTSVLNGSLTVSGNVVCNSGLTVGGNFAIGSLSIDNATLSGTLDANVIEASSVTTSGDITVQSPGHFVGDGSYLTGVAKPPTITNYSTTPASPVALNLTSLDNYFIFRANVIPQFYFTGYIIGQKITFMRTDIQYNVTLFYNDGVSIPTRVIFLTGTIANLNATGNTTILNYTYGGQQKIRSVFLVAPTSIPASFLFDLIEIS